MHRVLSISLFLAGFAGCQHGGAPPNDASKAPAPDVHAAPGAQNAPLTEATLADSPKMGAARPAYLAATSKQTISASNLGAQVLVTGAGGPYMVSENGSLAVSPLKKGLPKDADSQILGTSQDDAWVLTSDQTSTRMHLWYRAAHWENGRWTTASDDNMDIQLSDAQAQPQGFVVTSPKTSVIVTLGDNHDYVLTTIRDGKGTSRSVGKTIANDSPGAYSESFLGLPSGDVYIALRGALARVPADGEEVEVPLPACLGGVQDITITELDQGPGTSVVVGFKGTRNGAPWSGLGILRDASWEVTPVPSNEEVSRVAATTDGALWIVGRQGHVWRYLHEWEPVNFPESELRAEGFDTKNNIHAWGLATSGADDVWLAVHQEGAHAKSALLRTKPAGSVQHLPLRAKRR